VNDAFQSPNDRQGLSSDDAQDISRALLGIVAVAEKLTLECMEDMPPGDSRAHDMFHNADKSSATNYVMDAYLVMQYANLSGCDHVRGFVSLCRSVPPRSTALATLTRGALEAFSRTSFLLAGRDAKDLTHRHISCLYADFLYPARHNEVLFTRDGDRVNPAEQRLFFRSELDRLGLPAPVRVEVGKNIQDMLEPELGDGLALRKYSALSSIAHAHRSGMNVFIVTDESGGVTGLRASGDVVGDLAMQLMAAMSSTLTSYIQLFGARPRHVDLVESIVERAAEALARIWQRHR